jgi:hypothetical protein
VWTCKLGLQVDIHKRFWLSTLVFLRLAGRTNILKDRIPTRRAPRRGFLFTRLRLGLLGGRVRRKREKVQPALPVGSGRTRIDGKLSRVRVELVPNQGPP